MAVRCNRQLKNRLGRGLEGEIRHGVHHRADGYSGLQSQGMVRVSGSPGRGNAVVKPLTRHR